MMSVIRNREFRLYLALITGKMRNTYFFLNYTVLVCGHVHIIWPCILAKMKIGETGASCDSFHICALL